MSTTKMVHSLATHLRPNMEETDLFLIQNSEHNKSLKKHLASSAVRTEQASLSCTVEASDTATTISNNPLNFPDFSKLWQPRQLTRANLNVDYGRILNRTDASTLLRYLESSLEYYTGEMSKVQVFGRWHDIPRKQVAFGDCGLTYSFSGNTFPAKFWDPVLFELRNRLAILLHCEFNFVLVNRYKDGDDYIGEHRDNEKDLDCTAPIASVSLGQCRDFVLRHQTNRGKRKVDGVPTTVENVNILLEHGSLLVMRPPTNEFWYHSLPKRKNAVGVRINLTFRKLTNNN